MLRHTRFFLPLAALTVLTYFATEAALPVNAQPAEPPVAAGEAEEGVETLLRGPLHEAYAEPVQSDPSGDPVIPKKPPEPIEEIPPETKPVDEDVMWIPGYWAWDEDRSDFLWVSGVWRVPPPDRRWVPGYWTEADGGFQWVPGFWAPDEAERVEYLPQPPESLESGPTSDQPSDDYYWVSGCWQYRSGRYVWQPGYWGTYQDGWVWLPSHYTWTPRGVIYVGGYWDYPLRRRGQLFAPVYFHSPLYARSGYYYSPSVVIDTGHLLLHLFVQPRRHHYYWGDYYGDRYREAGYYSWAHRHDRFGYDPLFTYYQSHYRHRNIDFARRVDGWDKYYRKHEDRRPAHTYAAQAKLVERAQSDEHLQQSVLGRSTKEVWADSDSRNRYRRLEEKERRDYANNSRKEHREFSEQRVAIESRKTRPEERKADEKDDHGRRETVEWKLPENRHPAQSDSARRPPARTPEPRGDRDDREPRVPHANGNRTERPDRSKVKPDRPRDRDDGHRDDNRPKKDSSRDERRDDSKPKVEKHKPEVKDRPQPKPRPKADPPQRSKPERSKPAKKEKKD